VRRVRGAKPLAQERIYPYDEAAVVAIGEQCSMTERRADDATREVQAWLKCEYLQQHVGEEFNGVVSAVTNFGLFVELNDLYIEGLVHVSNLPADYYHFDVAQQRMIGERSGRSFQLGAALRVLVAAVNLDERKIDLEPVALPAPRKQRRAQGKPQPVQDKSGKKKPAARSGKSSGKAPPAQGKDRGKGAEGKPEGKSEGKSEGKGRRRNRRSKR